MRTNEWLQGLCLCFLFLAVGCGKSPLFNHKNADELKLSNGAGKDCPIVFNQAKLCASLTWTQQPTDEDGGAFTLHFWKKGGSPSGPFVDPGNKVAVKLWMPSMGHGSSPVKVASAKDVAGKTEEGIFEASEVYFIMPGDWEIWIQLKKGTQVVEQAKIDCKV